jgi:arylformamidase
MTGEALFRGFTQAELDRAYSPSSRVESIDPYLARYSADSEAARARHDPSRWKTHAYGASPAETLDLFMPHSTPALLLIFIHGGYWQALHKDDASFPAAAITGAGFAYAAINYTLAPLATMDQIVTEIRRALVWLWHNRRRVGLTDQFVVSGHSAGAHLAAMMLTTDWALHGIDAPFIKSGLLLGGIYDLEPIRLSYVNGPIGMDLAAARRNSPLFLKPATKLPLVIAWAERDTDEFKRQSQDLALQWRSAARDITVFEQPGVNHFDSLFDWYDARTQLSRETLRLLRA